MRVLVGWRCGLVDEVSARNRASPARGQHLVGELARASLSSMSSPSNHRTASISWQWVEHKGSKLGSFGNFGGPAGPVCWNVHDRVLLACVPSYRQVSADPSFVGRDRQRPGPWGPLAREGSQAPDAPRANFVSPQAAGGQSPRRPVDCAVSDTATDNTIADRTISIRRRHTRQSLGHYRQVPVGGAYIRCHAFIQNLRRCHYELGTYAPVSLILPAAFDELARTI